MFDGFGAGWISGHPRTRDPWGFGARFGYYTDLETGLVLLGRRYYDPGLARFLTRDPAGPAGGVNAYSYVANSPIGRADPSGLTATPASPAAEPAAATGAPLARLSADPWTHQAYDRLHMPWLKRPAVSVFPPAVLTTAGPFGGR